MSARPPSGRGAELGALALALVLLVRYMAPRVDYAWDFETFYHAAAALGRGLDPYRLESLAAVAGKTVPLPFLYPPAALALFTPLAALPLATATLVWLALKCGLAAGLVALWHRWFLPHLRLPLVIVVSLFAFNAAMVMDLRAGNLAVLEALLLWGAFACLLGGRRRAFAMLVAAAAVFKLLPIAFLALLLVPSRTPRASAWPALAALAAFVAVVFLPALFGASWPAALLAGAPVARPRGEFNPSALGILDTLLGGPAPGGPVADPALGLWALYAALVVVASLGLLRRAWRRRDPREWVVIACLLYGLLAPRMMAYSYVLLVPPALLLIHGLFPTARARAIAVAVLVAQGALRLALRADFLLGVPQLPGRESLPVANLPFLLLLGLWTALVLAGDRWRGLPSPATVAARTPTARAGRGRG